jgi:Actin
MSSSFYSGGIHSIEAVVVDIGAGNTKMGWAGDDYPRSIFRSVCNVAYGLPIIVQVHVLRIFFAIAF